MRILVLSILTLVLFPHSDLRNRIAGSPGERLDVEPSRDECASQPGYHLYDLSGKCPAPRGCGPFLHWNVDRLAGGKIPYYISAKGSKDVSLADIQKATEASFHAWNEIEGVALDFGFGGFLQPYTSGRYIAEKQFKEDEPDGKNVIFFDETGKFFPKDDPILSRALGRTILRRRNVDTGELYEMDIALNGTYLAPDREIVDELTGKKERPICSGYVFNVPIRWNLTEQRCVGLMQGTMNKGEYRAHLQSTLTHEMGHFIGFGHTSSEAATMSTSGFGNNTEQSTLEDEDRKGARFLYPSDMRVFSAPVEPYNIARGRPARITTNGANDVCNYCEKVWADITDGRYDYELQGDGQIEDGVVGWQNNDYNELMEVTVTFDLGQRFSVNKIRYATGNVHRAETWNADTMISPFGRTATRPGSNRVGVWTEHSGNLRASQVEITFQKTRKRYEEDWLFIGEIEIIGTPIEDYSSSRPTLRRKLDENTWEGNVNPRLCWQDTGLTVREGQSIEVSASGTVTWDPNINAVFGTVSPNGSGYPASRIAAVRQESFLVKSANTGSLIMRIGDLIYAVGKSSKFRVDQRGTVQLMINDEPEWLFDNSGRFFVRVRKE